MISYRDACPADASALATLGGETFVQTFGHLYAPADLALFLDNHTVEAWGLELGNSAFAVRIAEEHGAMIGYAKLGPAQLPFTPASGALELRQLYVLAPWQGKQVGTALIDWVIATARTRAASALFLSVFIDNHGARRFYTRYGFEPLGEYKFMVGTHADEDIVMRLAL